MHLGHLIARAVKAEHVLEDIEEDSIDDSDNNKEPYTHTNCINRNVTVEDSPIEFFENSVLQSVEEAAIGFDESIKIMDRPSLPLTGMPPNSGNSRGSDRSTSRASSSRLSFAERFRRQAQEAEAQAMEGLGTQTNWDAEAESVDIADGQTGESSEESSAQQSQKLPLREAPPSPDAPRPAARGIFNQDHLRPMAPLAPVSENTQTESDDVVGTTLKMRSLGRHEEVLLLPLVASIRSMYCGEFSRYQKDIKQLYRNDAPDANTISRIDKFLTDIKHICDHQDLVATPDSQMDDMSNETISQWAQNTSPKCLFLANLFAALKPHKISIAILAEPGLALDILASICDEQKVTYERPDTGSFGYSDGQLSVTLLPTGFPEDEHIVSSVDAVIAFDSSYFKGEIYSLALREHLIDPNRLAPLIHLVTQYSPDHAELCMPKLLDPIAHKRLLVSVIAEKRRVCGDGTYPLPQTAALRVARFIKESHSSRAKEGAQWPINQELAIAGLEHLPEDALQSQSGSTTQSASQSMASAAAPVADYPVDQTMDDADQMDYTANHNVSGAYSNYSTPPANKRARELGEELESKRMRMTPVGGASTDIVPDSVSRVPDSHSAVMPSQSEPSEKMTWTYAEVIEDRKRRDEYYKEQSKNMMSTVSPHHIIYIGNNC